MVSVNPSIDPGIIEALAAKELPHSREAEEAVLGSLLQDRDAVGDVVQMLTVADFHVRSHQLVFQALVDLFDRGSGIDLTILGEELTRRAELDRVGGALELARLIERVPSSANVSYHAGIVRDRSLERHLILTAQRILEDVRSGGMTVDEMVDSAETAIFEVARRRIQGEGSSLGNLLSATLRAIESRREGELEGIPSTYGDLDHRLCGLQKGQLVVLAARPSVGKTSLALNIALRAATRNEPPTGVAIFSFEMSSQQLAQNLLACQTPIDSQKLRTGAVSAEWERIGSAMNELSRAPIYIDDTPGMTTLQMRAKARRLKARHNIGLVIVDYLQLVSVPNRRDESRAWEISQVSMGLKRLARELEIPVIAISQLNRDVEQREDHRPRMSDLRESGSIEQDADVVLLLFRPELYDGGANPQTQNQANLIIAKNRNGPIGEVKLTFFASEFRFEPYSDLDFRG